MKKTLCCFFLAAFLCSCNSKKEESATTTTADNGSKSTLELPYKASFSSQWSTDVSDDDLKMVIVSYKDWADGNMTKLAPAYGDTIVWDRTTGDHYKLSNADLMKMWSTYRDSLSSVTIDMQAWHKMYTTDRKEGYIVAWYKEIDTYKDGRVDSAYYHDINQIKNGKITMLEQYKRPAK